MVRVLDMSTLETLLITLNETMVINNQLLLIMVSRDIRPDEIENIVQLNESIQIHQNVINDILKKEAEKPNVS